MRWAEVSCWARRVPPQTRPTRAEATKEVRRLTTAIADFQSNVLGDLVPTGLIEPSSLAVEHLKCPLGTYRARKNHSEPAWLAIASKELGVRESSGLEKNNARILEYLDLTDVRVDLPGGANANAQDSHIGFRWARDADAR